MLITAQEAKELSAKQAEKRRQGDISKTQTIMKNIKLRAEKGFYYYEYVAHVNYPIAKTLIENGFKLFNRVKSNNELSLIDFKDTDIYSVKISWE